MAENINALAERLQRLRTESEVLRRKREEDAKAAYKAIQSIPTEVVERLASKVPAITTVMKYSYEELLANENKELLNFQSVCRDLSNYIGERLSFYEEMLY